MPDRARAASLEVRLPDLGQVCADGPRAVRTIGGGADLAGVNGGADIARLTLRRPAPADARFASLRTDLPAVGTEVAGFHYPGGLPQAFSAGRIEEHVQCDWLGICPVGWVPGAEPDFLSVYWRQGSTAGGSSGSGLFDDQGRLIGILHGGASHAAGWNGPDDYGWVSPKQFEPVF